MSMSAIAARVAAALLTSEKGRKGVGFLLIAIFAPVILIAAILCSATSGGADHNNLAVEASFYGISFTDSVPAEFRTHITDMQSAFSFLDSVVAEANATMTDGNRLDPIQVKAIFYALCFGESAPSQHAADRFVDCFFITEQRTRIVVTELEDGSTVETEEVYTATVPLSLAAAYENLAAKLGRAVTDEDKENAAHIYTMIAGNANGSDGTGASGGTIQIDYGSGTGSTELDTSGFTNPAGKNADDLVQYAIHAYEEHWGYVWGTFGHVLTESLFEAKLAQYPDALAGNADFIRQTWVGGRTTDCVGLIKGYGWLDTETEEIVYNTNGMPDITANEMYNSATVSGTIDTIPETPGLAVWHDGHIGVYIGNGEVVEATDDCKEISRETFDALTKRRMENTGEVSGVFELDFDARTLSALNIMDGWKVYAMQDMADAAAQAYQEAEMSEDDRWRIFLDRLDGRELTTPSRLTARNFYFEDSIEAMDDRTLNFYVVPCFNVDEAFSTFVETDENDHALNIYANYDMQRQQVCDMLEITLYGSGIEDQSLTYRLNAAEKEVLREKMEAYCMQREHMPLNQLCQEILQEQDAPMQEMQL